VSSGGPARHLPYTPEAIQAQLSTVLLGRRVELHTQVGSTNDLVRRAAERGEPEGLVVLAEEQVRGRGRLGRTWIAPPGCCILCSVLLRPRFAPEHAFYLTIGAALAIYRACRSLSHEIARPDEIRPVFTIKWPNDVLLNGRKVSGVLSESEFVGGEWAFAVVGFGINVNLRPEDLGELRATATSYAAEMGREIDRTKLLAKVLGELEGLYFGMQRGQFGPIYSEWVGALETVGRRVTVQEPGGTVSGVAVRVETNGALVLRTEGGQERRVFAGDVLPGA
jgi:BirA family transcriptional regulator, biotin operon repressor / biotin---[acetyl-CoA-carboxylase] ligase